MNYRIISNPSKGSAAKGAPWAFTFVALGIMLLAGQSLHAEGCIEGTPIWQNIETNRMRCGWVGRKTNDTYYMHYDHRIWNDKAPNDGNGNPKGIASSYDHDHEHFNVSVTHGNWNNYYEVCTNASPMTVTNYWSYNVTYGTTIYPNASCTPSYYTITNSCFCDPAATAWACSTECAYISICKWVFIDTFYDLLGENYGTPVIIDSNTEYSTHSIWQFPNNWGWQTNLDETIYSAPYTLPQFMDHLMASVQAVDWTDGHGGNVYLNDNGSDKRSLYARYMRYSIKFPSEAGVEYKVTWDLKLDYTSPLTNTVIIPGLTWRGWGNGMEVQIGLTNSLAKWYSLPNPAYGDSYTPSVINIKVTPLDGSCSSGECEGGGNAGPGDGPDFLGSLGFLISLGAGTVEESAGILYLEAEKPSSALATPAGLRFDVNSSVVTVVTNGDGSIHVAAPTLLARIAATNSYAYWIHCSAKSGAAYLTNTPFLSHLIVNTNGSASTNTLLHVRYRSGSILTNYFVCEVDYPTNTTWALISGNGLKGSA